MPWFDECRFDVEDVDFVEHGLYQAFDGVFGRAVGAEAWYPESAGCGGEDEVATMVLGAEVWERELDYVEGAEEVGTELVAKVVVVLVFAGTYNTYHDCELICWSMIRMEHTIAGTTGRNVRSAASTHSKAAMSLLCYDVDIPPTFNALLNYSLDRFPHSYIAQNP